MHLKNHVALGREACLDSNWGIVCIEFIIISIYINMNSFMKMVPCHLHAWDLCLKRLCKDLMFIKHYRNTALRKELLPGFLS